MDKFIVNYDMDSDDEWNELYADDLGNDQLLLEDDSDADDNSSCCSIKGKGSMVNRIGQRAQLKQRELKHTEDAEELRENGFIVDDD